ncbi:Protein zgrf1 [Coemansia erecta]|nr:Protein zgrf1 [Coemansia erecta]
MISCVRTENIGFISNPNRVNVALSRARNHCLILGARKLLETNPMWRKIIEYCRSDGGSMSVCPAQAFVNCISETIVMTGNAQQHESGEYKSPQTIDSIDAVSVDVDSQNRDFDEMAVPDDAENVTDKGDSEEYADIEEYGDDSVIGGALSQWSPSAFGSSSFFDNTDMTNGASSTIDYYSQDDGGADIIDCLDVNLDEM